MDWLIQDERPIFQQLYEQLARKIVSGVYAPGERLPSVRDLAFEAGVNPNTMQRAFSQLDSMGLTESIRTSGRSVTTDTEKIAELQHKLVVQAAQEYLHTAASLGYNAEEAVQLLLKEGISNE